MHNGLATAQDRAEGYRGALRRHKIPVEAGLVTAGGEFKQASGYQLVKQLLTHHPRPTAIFAANNLIAVGALQALREASLRVPEDMALVSFDDVGVASVIDPFFTVVAQPAYEMGEKSARLLIERLAAKRNIKTREIIFAPRLIIRQSCGQGLAEKS